MIQDSFSTARMPDFKARAEAKKAWVARRSAPRSGLFLGLLAGGAIGCLSALAVMSVIPNDARAPAPGVVDNRVAIAQPVRPANEAPASKAATDTSTADRREIRQVSTDRSAPPSAAAATPAAAPAVSTPAPALAVTRAVTPPVGFARTDVSANAKPPLNPVAAAAAIPAVPTSAVAEEAPPVLAQTDATEQKPKVAEKKREKKKQIVRQRNRQPSVQWARPDNFFFGGDRMARSF
jgi:hypothetical protein